MSDRYLLYISSHTLILPNCNLIPFWFSNTFNKNSSRHLYYIRKLFKLCVAWNIKHSKIYLNRNILYETSDTITHHRMLHLYKYASYLYPGERQVDMQCREICIFRILLFATMRNVLCVRYFGVFQISTEETHTHTWEIISFTSKSHKCI